MSFRPERLLAVLKSLPPTPRYWIAYSGGRDSQVLLHAMAVLRGRYSANLRAVHVNHGLQSDAGIWSRHCEGYCGCQGIALTQVELKLERARGQSMEAVAREARYRAIEEVMGVGEILLTAHHQEDQAETVLLQLLRGSGPGGLAAMPTLAAFGPGFLARPLLAFKRSQLAAYALESSLTWVEDSSNENTGFDRNYLRHRVMPLIVQRWPSMAATLSRSARHCAEAQHLIEEAAVRDCGLVATQKAGVLSAPALLGLPGPRRRAVLRHWFRQLGFPLPDTVHLDRISREVLSSGPHRVPRVTWSGVEVRRYRGGLYAMPPLPVHAAEQRLAWDGASPLPLPSGLGTLRAQECMGSGIAARLWKNSRLSVGFRQGGERCRPAGRGHRHRLKKLFQEQGISPWQRDRIPLLFLDDQLALITGLCICEPFQAAPGEPGVKPVWNPEAGADKNPLGRSQRIS